MQTFPAQLLIENLQYWLVILLMGGVGILALLLFAYGLVVWWRNKDREEKSLDYVLLQVSVPAGNETKIDVAEQMFASLYSIKKSKWPKFLNVQPHICLEIVGKNEDIRFYVSVPRKLQDLVEKQINSAYPDAEILVSQEYNIFSKTGRVVFAELEFKKEAHRPIKTYKDLPTDPLSAITTVLGKMGQDEGAVVQIVISPADGSWQSAGKSFVSQTKKSESDPEKAKFKVDARVMEAIDNKCSKPGFETAIRLVVSAASEDTAKLHLSNLKSAFSQFNSDLNSFSSRKIWVKHAFMMDFIYRYQSSWRFFAKQTVLNSEELATIFHFPNKQVETPNIHRIYSRRAPAPPTISKEGLYLGKSEYRGVVKPVYLSESDRRRHIYIIGKTGVGKTELLRDLLLQDIRSGKGVCLIDPHDLAEDILNYIPPERAKDVIYFDVSDTDRPMGLNLLEAGDEQQKHFVTGAIINLMYKLYDPYKTGIIGPRFEHAIRNAMLTVMDAIPNGTFVEVVQTLQRPDLVNELLPKVKDPLVRRYWTDQIAQTTDFHKSEVLDYIVSKFGRFVTNKMMRNIIGQSKSAFDFRKVMDEGKILIINVAKGKVGEENSSFLGLILVPRILMAAMSRTDIPEEQRRDFYLYVDEFQNFATPDFATILSEARKYKLNLTVANQFVGQMDEEIKNAVFGNVGTIVSFNIGVTDANFLQHWFQPTFSEDDLINIERFHAYVKTIVRNEPVPAFSMDTTKDLEAMKRQADPRVGKMIKELSRLTYGRDMAVVEEEISRRAKL